MPGLDGAVWSGRVKRIHIQPFGYQEPWNNEEAFFSGPASPCPFFLGWVTPLESLLGIWEPIVGRASETSICSVSGVSATAASFPSPAVGVLQGVARIVVSEQIMVADAFTGNRG